MNKEQANNLWPLMKAYSEGATIEFREKPELSWIEASYPDFLKHNEYRIKPEPKLVPFTFEDKQYFKNLWFKSKGGNGTLNSLVQITKDDVLLVYGAKNLRVKYIELLNSFEFEDGSPCGKYVNE